MRRTRFIPALLVLLLSACNQQLIETQLPEGEVTINLSADERVEIVSAKSGTELPDVGDFWVEIYNSEMVKFKKEKYSDIAGKTLSMNAGTFTLVASHGDPLGVGFDKPYYKAETTFTVEPQKRANVEATAKLANVKVAVDYGDQIKADYTDFYTVVKHAELKKTSLKFEDDETRPGYIPGGDLTVTVYATVGGQLKCFTLKDNEGNPAVINCQPNDYITFNVNTAVNYGNLIFDVKIDNGTELVEKTFYAPADAAGSDLKPSIVLSTFDESGNYYVTEGVAPDVDDLGFTYKAYAGLEECVLSIDCDYMENLGIPSQIDIAALDDAGIAALESKGFFLAEHAGIGVIDITDFVPGMARNAVYNGKGTVLGTFTLKIKDAEGTTATKTAKIMLNDVTAVIDIKDYNVWSKKIVDPVVTLSNGKTEFAKVQVSMDGVAWYDFKDMTANPFNMGTIADLTSNTTYHYRVVYRDNHVVSAHVSVRTESEQQVGNSGFEDWNTRNWDFNHNGSLGGQSSPMKYYKPWSSSESDIWWDSNTTNSLRSSLTIGYTFFKTFPLVHYSTDAHSGTKAAQLTVANVGDSNSTWATTGTWYVGELFIGKGNDGSDGDWSKTNDGHSFSSRPASMTFWYEYAPYTSSHTFSAEVSVLAADNTVIGTGKVTPGTQAEWKSVNVPISYSVTNKKAASIRISFKASTASDFSCSNGGHYLEIAGSRNEGDMYRIKLNATLRIDDVKLNY